MQQGLINFVACTSTLAQGVNLPIRYLIVSGLQLGGEKFKVRDFQNLIGRAGRSGMHTEGLVIFSETDIFDKKETESKKFKSSVELLSPDHSESTTSSLLELLAPLRSSDGWREHWVTADVLCRLMLADEDVWLSWANEVVRSKAARFKFTAKTLVAQLRRRRRFIFALESYLMANRGTSSFDEFKAAAERLATATLAYHLASDEVKPAVSALFISVAEYLQQQEPEPEKQAAYSKTLLGVKTAKLVEHWVISNRDFLLTLDSNEEWLAMVWGLFSELSKHKFFHTVKPDSLAIQLATQWIQGSPYLALFEHSKSERGNKPWGKMKPRPLTEDDIVEFCEKTLGFECSLILSAVAQFLFGENGNQDGAAALSLFQKALKYGLPDGQSISCYEHGFADRIVSQRVCAAVRDDGFSEKVFAPALKSHRGRIEATLNDYPRYFESVLVSRA